MDLHLANGLDVGLGASLLCGNQFTLHTPDILMASSSTFGWKHGNILVDGSLHLDNGKTLNIELHAEARDQELALFRVFGEFRAGGRLNVVGDTSYQPRAGDRFVIVEFESESESYAMGAALLFEEYSDTLIAGSEVLSLELSVRKVADRRYALELAIQDPLDVRDLRVTQDNEDKQVRIEYNIISGLPPISMSLNAFENETKADALPLLSLSGHVGTDVPAGLNRRIIWDAAKDWNDQLAEQALFELRAWRTTPSGGIAEEVLLQAVARINTQVEQCVNWAGATTGQFSDPDNWDSEAEDWDESMVPGEDHSICLDGTDAHRILLRGLTPNRGTVHGIQELNVERGQWEIDFTGWSPTPHNQSLAVTDGVKVSAGARLTVTREFSRPFPPFDGAALSTPVLHLEPDAQLGLKYGMIQIDGDLILDDRSELQIVLYDEGKHSGVGPLLKVTGQFRAGGRLNLIPDDGYRPEAGDRFRLVEFEAASIDVEHIYEHYRFKDYSPEIPGRPDLIWGLAFRQEGGLTLGRQFLEVVVMRKPQRSVLGTTLMPAANRDGLIFVTHGTASSIGGPNDGAFGELAAEIRSFLINHAKVNEVYRWDVATFDWREFATDLDVLKLDFTYNAATSAQIGIGLGESLEHWMRHGDHGDSGGGFAYKDMHLLSHSSGSWLVNRMMGLESQRGVAVHLTLFDAFVNPSEDSGIFSGRFDAELGVSGPRDFVDHYVERVWSPPGTKDLLRRAVNFNVTWAETQSGIVLPRQRGMAEAHRWPYEWYLETVRYANNPDANPAPFDGVHCAGFLLSEAFLESAQIQEPGFATVLRLHKSSLDARRRSLAAGALELVIGGGQSDCHLRRTPLVLPDPNAFGDITFAAFGIYDTPADGQVSMATGTASTSAAQMAKAGFETTIRPMDDTGAHSWAAVTNQVEIPHTVSEVHFTFQFTEGSSGVLSVFAGQDVLVEIDREMVGDWLTASGAIQLHNPWEAGSHELVFLLESNSEEPSGILLKDLAFGYEIEPRLLSARRDGDGVVAVEFSAIPERPYILQTTKDLRDWADLAPVISSDWLHQWSDALPVEETRLFRVMLIAEEEPATGDPDL